MQVSELKPEGLSQRARQGVCRRKPRRGGAALAFALGALSLGGCLPYGKADPVSSPVNVPSGYASAKAKGERRAAGGAVPSQAATEPARGAVESVGPEANTPWWVGFSDPELDALIKRALANNRDLRVAWARIEEARALAGQAQGARYPTLNATGQATWGQAPFPAGGVNAQTTTLRGSLPVTYEVDWMGRYAGKAEAATLSSEASRYDMEAAAVSIAAQVAEAWFDLVAAQARIALLEEQQRVNENFLELTRLRFEKGLTTTLDVHQQRQQVEGTRAQLALSQTAVRTALNQLAVLVGDMPEGQHFGAQRIALPQLHALPDPGLPGNLIRQRPDLRAAEKRTQAADENVAVAIAGRLPTLTLNGSVGYVWTQFKAVNVPAPQPGAMPSPFGSGKRQANGVTYDLGAVLNMPLFDGFQRKREVDINRAKARQAVENYANVIQQAVREVDTSIAAERNQAENIEALKAQLAATRDALEVARELYRQGLSDFLPVLTALNGSQQIELTLLSSERQRLSYRVQLHRALGGTWTSELKAPQPDKASR